jgi:signal transduction histidine kinase
MRAPLRAMQSFASFLVDEHAKNLDEQGLEYLQQIMRSAVRLDRLIQDVLRYSRVMQATLPTGEVDMEVLVRDIAQIFRSQHPEAEIVIHGKLPVVKGNEALLAQCVMHLLGNAVKFVEPGKIPRVEIQAEEIGSGEVRLWLKDNGVGIAPENHHRIFRVFEKLHPESEYEGTGIGLAIVRKAVERMGAKLGLDSELNRGSKFWIELKKGNR